MDLKINNNNSKKEYQRNKRREKRIILILIMIFSSILIYMWYPAILRSLEIEEKVEHKIYKIYSNDDFKKYSSIKGKGTLNDPFILKDINFKTERSGIHIKYTDVHFHIRNNKFKGLNREHIILESTNNITIINNLFTKSDLYNYHNIGIKDSASSDLIIEDNRFENLGEGISIENSFGSIIKNNSFLNCDEAFKIKFPYELFDSVNIISNNKVINCTSFEIGKSYMDSNIIYKGNIEFTENYFKNTSVFFRHISDANINNNTFNETPLVSFYYVENFLCFNNVFNIDKPKRNYYNEISIFDSSYIKFEYNSVYSNLNCLKFNGFNKKIIIFKNELKGEIGLNLSKLKSLGVKLKDVQIFNNNFNCMKNIIINLSDFEHEFAFDNGFIGNYWNDYYGIDNNGDGIGDTPYFIAPDIYDNYPLMNPP